jgi:large subunit ribosomal protein L10
MNREEKATAIEEIAAQIEGSEAIFAVDYRGISVTQAAELRSKLRDADASFRVVKNRLTKIAADKAGEERLAELLQGPTALTFVRGDTAMAAKAISTFNKEHEILTFKGGFMEGIALDDDKFKSIARLPSRDVLNGQFAGVVASPLTGLVRGLGSMIQGLASQLGQIADRGLVSGEAPAKETQADEPAIEEPQADEALEPESDSDASAAGDAVGGTAPEEASATAGGGGSPAAAGPAEEAPEPGSDSEEETSKQEEEEK